MNRPLQRGQALVLIALAFVGLAAFIGLAIDAGILFTSIGHLRRATDAAALAAANQFREGRQVSQIEASATEFITLNALNPATADVYICDIFNSPPDPSIHDPTLCPGPGEFDRKFVRVEARMPVEFVFLPLVGWRNITISANSVSEAASIDLVLVIDTSSSMAFDLCTDGKDQDDDDGDGIEGSAGDVVDDCPGFPTPQSGPTSDADVALCIQNRLMREAGTCSRADGCPPQDDCLPFEEVRDAAAGLIARTYFPYDRMSIIEYSDVGSVAIDLVTGTNATSVSSALGSLDVRPDPSGPQCDFGAAGNPSGCTSTNTADGLTLAGNQFGLSTREEAVWIVILLSDGAANAARTTASPPTWVCPGGPSGVPTWVQPFCRDPAFNGSGTGSFGYDPEDAARAAALFVGCPDGTTGPLPPGCSLPGQAAVIFTIGLGNLMTLNTSCDTSVYGPGGCQADQGERLLRWIAGVGDDGNPSTNPDCSGAPTGTDCGNYYFSPTGTGLMRVFEAIASRIFTRITH